MSPHRNSVCGLSATSVIHIQNLLPREDHEQLHHNLIHVLFLQLMKNVFFKNSIKTAKILEKKSKRGKLYFGCENNPECDFMSWNKPTGEKCPKCGSPLEEKGRKNPKIVCSNEKCGFVKEKPAEEETED